jgi:hypothetical protein
MNPDEREWQAQEAATGCVRSGTALHELDSASASYVALVRALREPIEVQLPADFARRVALRAVARASARAVESRLEQHLLWILGVLFGIAALAAAVIYGGNWLEPSIDLTRQLIKPSLLLSLAGCLAFSAFSQQLPRLLGWATRRDA